VSSAKHGFRFFEIGVRRMAACVGCVECVECVGGLRCAKTFACATLTLTTSKQSGKKR